MTDRHLRIYLDWSLLQWARKGTHNFLNRLSAALAGRGWTVELVQTGDEARRRAPALPGYALYHMEMPTHDRALTFRRSYIYPFWRIEASSERWHWPVAKASFPPADLPRAEAEAFGRFWRQRLYPDTRTSRDGYVFMPLQGRLSQHRSFQSMSPMGMIRATLRHLPKLPIRATLHPKETYSQAELDALDRLQRRRPRLTVETVPSADLLAGCDLVVTQNSSLAFEALFYRKPSVLFARIDFHHIARSVVDLGAEAAFDRIGDFQPDYDGYLWWFLQAMSINAGQSDAETLILRRFADHGWPV